MPASRWTPEHQRAALQQAARELSANPIGRRQYEQWQRAHADAERLPPGKTIERHFGTWSQACAAAGLQTRLSNRPASSTSEPELPAAATRATGTVISSRSWYQTDRFPAGRALGALAESKGLSRAAVARHFSWRPSASAVVSGWLSGNANITPPAAAALCLAIGVTPNAVAEVIGGPGLHDFLRDHWHQPDLTDRQLEERLWRAVPHEATGLFSGTSTLARQRHAADHLGVDRDGFACAVAVTSTAVWKTKEPETKANWGRGHRIPPPAARPASPVTGPQTFPRRSLFPSGSLVTVTIGNHSWPALILRSQGVITSDSESAAQLTPETPSRIMDLAPGAPMSRAAVQEPDGTWTPAVLADKDISALVAPPPADHGWCGPVPWGEATGTTVTLAEVSDRHRRDISWADTWLQHFNAPDVHLHAVRSRTGNWDIRCSGDLPDVTLFVHDMLLLEPNDTARQEMWGDRLKPSWLDDPRYGQLAEDTFKGWDRSSTLQSLADLADRILEDGPEKVARWHDAGITDAYIIQVLSWDIGIEDPGLLKTISIWKDSPD